MTDAQTELTRPLVGVSWHERIAILSIDAPPVNAIAAPLCAALLQALASIAEARPAAAVIMSGGAHFSAGKDMAGFDGVEQHPSLTDVQSVMERSTLPIVAAVDGAAMGAGLDLALTAHYRIAAPTARLSLPEINLGIVGGCQRLLRAIGVEPTLNLALSGREFTSVEALRLGVVDCIADGPLQQAAIAFARDIVREGRPLRLLRDEVDRLPPLAEAQATLENSRRANATRYRGQVAPEAILKVVEAGVALPFDDAVREEYRLCDAMLSTAQSKAQQYYFAAERQAAVIPDIPADQPLRDVKTVGIIGAGLMGGGIAMAFASSGYSVTIIDRARDALDRGLATIRENYERTAARGGLSAEEVERRLDRIAGAVDMSALAGCDLVVEAVFEQMATKRSIFAELGQICRPGAILATNTSGLDVNAIAAVTGRPQDVIGLHFFSPAHIMKLVEVVRGEQTAKDVVATAMKLSRRIGKIPVLVGVCPGFVGNRMLIPRQDEAGLLLLEGVPPDRVDGALFEFGFPMGPFAMADMAGLDIGWDEAQSNGGSVQDRLCELGRKGQKTDGGYYDYDDSRKARPSAVTAEVIAQFRQATGQTADHAVSDEEILDRCIGLMINEGAKILAEGKAIRASDIDVIYVNGYGWPKHKGGPMYYAGQIGLAALCSRLDTLSAAHGSRFEPAPLLRDLVTRGESFSDFDKRRSGS